VLDHEFRLLEKPVGRAAFVVAGARKVQPSHEDAAVGRAPDVQFGLVDVELLEPEVPERSRRQRRQHPRQAQRRPSLRVQQDHVREFEGRDQAFTDRRNAADAHGYPQNPPGFDFQVGAKLSDSGHNPDMKRSPGERQDQPDGQQKPQKRFRDGGISLQRT
jgi:hypothetical protein